MIAALRDYTVHTLLRLSTLNWKRLSIKIFKVKNEKKSFIFRVCLD